MSKPEDFQQYNQEKGFTPGGAGGDPECPIDLAPGRQTGQGCAEAAGDDEPFEQKLARIKRELDAVPALPGVYLWKDKTGQVIYVGKAKYVALRRRAEA